MFELTPTTMWIIGGLLAVIYTLFKIVVNKIHAELLAQKQELSNKANNESLHEMEQRWKDALEEVKENNEKVIYKLETRHDKEVTELENRLGARIDRSEENILKQLRLMMEAIRN